MKNGKKVWECSKIYCEASEGPASDPGAWYRAPQDEGIYRKRAWTSGDPLYMFGEGQRYPGDDQGRKKRADGGASDRYGRAAAGGGDGSPFRIRTSGVYACLRSWRSYGDPPGCGKASEYSEEESLRNGAPDLSDGGRDLKRIGDRDRQRLSGRCRRRLWASYRQYPGERDPKRYIDLPAGVLYGVFRQIYLEDPGEILSWLHTGEGGWSGQYSGASDPVVAGDPDEGDIRELC